MDELVAVEGMLDLPETEKETTIEKIDCINTMS